MAVTTDPNAVFYSYRGVGGNSVVDKFIGLLDQKGIPHRGSESGPIEGALTDFEEKIGSANIIVIFYSQKYFESEHCMNEYANIRKYENDERKAATYYVKCDDYNVDELIRFWGGQKATLENQKSETLKSINRRTKNNGCYIDINTPYCVQKLNDYFSVNARFYETNLQDLVGIINDKYHELSARKTSANQGNANTNAPSFEFYIQPNLIARDSLLEKLHDLVTANQFSNLCGFGGSGKTSLVNLFVEKYAAEFNQTAYVVVNNSVRKDFVAQINDTIKLFKYEEKKDASSKKIKDLAQLAELTEEIEDRYNPIISYLENNYTSDKPNLLIIDINNAPDGDAEKFGEELVTHTQPSNKIFPKGWKYLIVSRENIYKGIPQLNLNLNETENETANFDFLKELFLENAGRDKYKDFSDEDFAQLFQKTYYSPLMAEQLGIYLKDFDAYSLSDIFALLDKDDFKNQKRVGVTSQNRHTDEEKSLIGFLRNLVVLDKLKPAEQLLLKHFALWPTDYIPEDVIKTLLKKTFESETNRWTKLWSIIKHTFDLDPDNRIGVFYNRTKRYKVSKKWEYFYWTVIIMTTLIPWLFSINHHIISSLYGMIAVLCFILIGEILYHNCTFRPPSHNILQIALGGGVLAVLLSGYFGDSIFILLIAPLSVLPILRFPSFMKKIFKCLVSNKYIFNTDKDNIESTLLELSQKKYVSQKIIDNQKCYKLHGLIAESIREQIDIPNTDFIDYLSTIRKILKNNDKDFAPFAQCIGYSLSEFDITINHETLFRIAYRLDSNIYPNIKAALYNKVIKVLEGSFYIGRLYDLAKSFNYLALFQQNQLNDYHSAFENYNKAITILKKYPKDHDCQILLADSYNGLAYCYDKQSNYEEAIKSVTNAIEIAYKCKEKDSKDLIDWVNCRRTLCEIKFNNGKDLEEVKETLMEIKPLAQKCLADHPNSKDAKSVNKEIDELLAKIEKVESVTL